MSKPPFDPTQPYEDLPEENGYEVRLQNGFKYKRLKQDPISIDVEVVEEEPTSKRLFGSNETRDPFQYDMGKDVDIQQQILNYEAPNQPDLGDYAGALAIETGYNMAGRAGGMVLGSFTGPAAPIAVPVFGFIGNGVGAFIGSIKAQEHLGMEVSYGRALLDTVISYNPFGSLAKGAKYATKTGTNTVTKIGSSLTAQKIMSKNFENQLNTFAQASETLVNKALSNQHITRVGGNAMIGATYGSFRELSDNETRMGAIFNDAMYSGVLGELMRGGGKVVTGSMNKVKNLTVKEFDEAIKRGDKHPTLIKNILDGNVKATDSEFAKKLSNTVVGLKTQLSDQFEYIKLLSKEGGGNDYFRKNGILNSDGDYDKPYQAFRLVRPLQERKKTIAGRQINVLKDAVKQFAFKNGVNKADFEKDLDTFVYAKHMLDLNKHGGKGKKGAASGIDSGRLASMILNIKNKPYFDDIQRVANEIQGVSRQILDQAVESGFISKQGAKELRTKYPNYVPMFKNVGKDDILNTSRPVFPLSKKGPASLIRKKENIEGKLELKPVLTNVRDSLNDMIMKGERNKAMQVLATSIAKNEAIGLGKVKNVFLRDKKGKKIDDPYGARGIPFSVNGKTKMIEVKDDMLLDTLRGMSLEKGIKMFSVQNFLLNTFATINKFQGAQLTGLNPDFQLANLFRDRGEAFFQAMAKMDTREAASLLNPKVLGQDMVTIIRSRMPNKKMNKDDAEYQLFLDSGAGNVSGLLSGTLADLRKGLDDMNIDAGKITGNFNKKARMMGNAITTINDIFEQSSRFATFRSARKSGMTVKEAALAARDSSFDPLLRGSKSNIISAAYIFANPALQSTKNFLRRMDLSRPENRKATATMMTGWFSLNTMQNQWNSSIIGDDWREKFMETLPEGYAEYTLNNHIVIANPFVEPGENIRYVKLPVPYSQVPAKLLTDGTSRLIFDEKYRTSGDASLLFGKTVSSMFDNMSPVPRGFMPTVYHNAAGTLGLLGIDENVFGGNIKTWTPPLKDNGVPYTNKELKEIAKAKDMVPVGFDDDAYGRFLIKATDYVNTVLKQDDMTMITPETLKFGFDTYFPLITKTGFNAYEDLNNLFNAAKYGKGAKDLDFTKMTGVRRFFGELPISKMEQVLEINANSEALDQEFFQAKNDNKRDYKFLTKEYVKLQNNPNTTEEDAILFNQKLLEMTKGRPQLEERFLKFTKQYQSGVDTFTERSFMELPAHKKAQRYVEHLSKLKDPQKIGTFLQGIVELGGGEEAYEDGSNKMLNPDIQKYMRIVMDMENSPFFQEMSAAQRQEALKAAFKAIK